MSSDASFAAPEDVYELTPVQNGMLFHALAEPGSGVYVVQLHVELGGPLDPPRLRAAWRRAVQRHPALRTAFLWEGLDEPLQAVRFEVDLPWTELDWSRHAQEERQELLENLLLEERVRGFDLARAPLMRLVLVKLDAERHLLLWTVHHLIIDGWSTVLVLDEVFAQLLDPDAGVAAGPSRNSVRSSDRTAPAMSGVERAPAAPPPFKHFVEWLARRDPEPDRQFWSDALVVHRGPAPLAVARASSSRSGRERRTRRLGPERSTALREWARRHRLTLATVVHGAWALVLGRYAEGGPFTYGTVFSGRPATLPGADRLVGPLIATVPVAMDALSGEVTLDEWLVQLQDHLSRLRESEHLAPLEIVAQRPEGTPRTLFDSVLVVENAPPLKTAGWSNPGGIRVGPVHYLDQSHYDVALLVMPGEELEMTLLHRTARLDADSAEVLLDHVMSTLESMIGSTATPLRLHAPPSKAERNRIEKDIQPSGYAGPVPDLAEFDVVERFRRWAASEPDRVAILAGERAWSYSDLDLRSDALAARLQRDGESGHGARVAVLAGRTPELVAGVFGVLKAGSAYVPLDPSYPEARLRLMVEASGARTLLVAPDQRDHPLTLGATRVALIEPLEHVGPSPSAIQPVAQPGDLAYVVFTSGSTGPPKAVGVTRRNIAYSTWARGPAYGEVPERFLLVSPTSFDSSKVGLFWPLSTGGTLVLTPDRQERDPDALHTTLRTNGITHVLYVPAIHEWILDRAAREGLPSLRSVIVAGEECSASLVRRHHRVMPHVRLYNEYGPTEATVWAAVHRCSPSDVEAPPPIGRPIPGTRILVLDAHLEPAPILVGGEIYVDGPGVTPGYLNDGAATSRSFVRTKSGTPGGSMYRTGDRGRFLRNGDLEFLGRVDRQIKIRGHRVELEAIEATLERHPAVSAAAVTVARNDHGLGPVVAWVVGAEIGAGGAPAQGPDGRSLRTFAAAELPAHMVPDRVEFLEALPRGPTGKVDRALLEKRGLPERSPNPTTAPRTDTERKVADVWCEVLKVSAVGVEESFFAMGGHSLLAVRLLGKLREAFNIELPMEAVFEHPTVRALAARLDAVSTGEPAADRETFTF